MKDRIIKLRKELKLSQSDFAKRLNLSRNFIGLVECGDRNISDRTISDICREFNINEEWIRFGVEPMKRQPDDEIAEIVDNLLTEDTPFYSLIKGILKTYNEADDKSKQCLEEFAEALVINLKKED